MKKSARAFTLIELLVVIAITGLLMALLLPALQAASQAAKLTTCGARLHQLGLGVLSYSVDNNGEIPVGPDVPHMFFGTPRRQVATTYAWVGSSSALEGVGVILDNYMPAPEALFCPADTTQDPVEELAHIRARGAADGFTSYLYRHLDQTTLPFLEDLGTNETNADAHMLMMDINSFGTLHPSLYRTNHGATMINILYIDGHVKGIANEDQALSIDEASANATFFNPSATQRQLDQIVVNADYAESGTLGDAPQLP